MTMGETIHKRLYVGGLNSEVSAHEILERFSRFGTVSNLSITRRTDDKGNQVKSFAHLDIAGDEVNIRKCFNTYQNAKWKGSVLKLQYAKESFLTKLEKEREEPIQNQVVKSPKVTTSQGESNLAKPVPTVLEVKGSAVPGTPVPGKEDWVVGKYGRVLPVLKLKKSYKLKMVKHDPSKYCHAAKVFKDDKTNGPTSTSCDNLTWEINTPDSEITRKRKGEFPETSHSGKRKMESVHLKSHKFDQTSSSMSRSYKSEGDSEDFEIVKSGASNRAQTNAIIQQRNKFDSDVDSDSEVVSTMSAKEKKKNGQVKEVQKSTYQVSKVESSSVMLSQKSNCTSVSVQQPSATNKRVKGSDSRGKIPEFKGLQMLDLVAKKSDRLSDTKRQSQNLTQEKFSETDVKVKSGDDEHGTASDANKIILEFGGLSMLSGTLDPGDRISSWGKTVTTDSWQQQPSAKKQTQALLQKSLGESMKMSPLVNRVLSAYSSEHKKGSFLSNTSEEIPVASTEKDIMECHDSASSADTDEILSQCRSKYGILSSSSAPTKPNFACQSSKHLIQNSHGSGMAGTPSLLNHSLYLSEITAGTPEMSIVSPKDSISTHIIQSSPFGDSSDSELDSNDFEFVVKKLAKKAASSSKLGNVSMSERVSKDKKLKNEAGMIIDKVGNFKNIRQQGAEVTFDKSHGDVNKLNTSLQSRLMGIADGHLNDTSSAPVSSLKKILAEESDTKRCKVSNKSPPLRKSEQDEASDKSKHLADNKKRLEAVKEHLKQKQLQQNVMRKALQNVDTQDNSSSKRIVFSSSDDDASDENDDDDNEDDDHSSMKDSNDSSYCTNRQIKEKGKLRLLGNSSEDEEESDYEEMFKSKPHFEGQKGEKLMKLERKIGDSRFKLDAKFAESDSEEESQSKEKLLGIRDVDPSLEEEKAASLKVLENVIGKTTLDQFSEKIKRNTKHLIDMNAVRFDPTKIANQTNSTVSTDSKKVTEEVSVSPLSIKHNKKTEPEMRQAKDGKHSEDVQGKATKGNEQKRPSTDKDDSRKVENVLENKPAKKQKCSTESEAGKSNANHGGKSKVHLATSLVDLFKKKQDNENEEQSQSFSLLKQFDLDDTDESDNSNVDEYALDDSFREDVLSGLLKTADPQKKPVTRDHDTTTVAGLAASLGEHSDSDSGDSIEEQEDDSGGRKISFPCALSGEETSEGSDEGETLPMDDELPCAAQDEEDNESELANAGRVDVRFSKEQWQQRWEEIRPVLVKMYKRKHKEALKNKRAHSQIKRKREFLKKSRKGYTARKTR